MNNYCVYMHIFPNGKRYIGQTKQKPEYRFNNGEGYKGCRYVYSAIKKYGWENIKHIVLIDNLSSEDANYYERFYIDLFKSNDRDYGYNLKSGGTFGYRYTDDAKDKMSQSQKGRVQSEATKAKRSKSLLHYYQSHEVSEEIKMKLRRHNSGQFKRGQTHAVSSETRAKISNALKGRKGTPLTAEQKEHLSKMLKGRPVSDNSYNALEPYRYKSGHKVSDYTIKRIKESNSKAVLQYDLGGNYITSYSSIKEASISVGLSENAVGNCVRGYAKTAGGYIWRYANAN